MRAYSSAMRMIPERTTGRPSSVIPTAPASIISPTSVSCSPFCSTVMQPVGYTRAPPERIPAATT